MAIVSQLLKIAIKLRNFTIFFYKIAMHHKVQTPKFDIKSNLNLTRMKKSALIFFLVAIFLSTAVTLHGQTTTAPLDQRKLISQFEGKWQAQDGKDTLQVWDWHSYGKSNECLITLNVGGNESPIYKNMSNFDSRTKKFIGANFFYGGWSNGWTGSFVSEKKLVIDHYRLSEPNTLTYKVEFVFETPDSFTAVFNNLSRNTFTTLNFSRIK
jgi:hypothetical protein